MLPPTPQFSDELLQVASLLSWQARLKKMQSWQFKVGVYMGSGESTITGKVDSSGCTSIELSLPEGRLEVESMD